MSGGQAEKMKVSENITLEKGKNVPSGVFTETEVVRIDIYSNNQPL